MLVVVEHDGIVLRGGRVDIAGRRNALATDGLERTRRAFRQLATPRNIPSGDRANGGTTPLLGEHRTNSRYRALHPIQVEHRRRLGKIVALAGEQTWILLADAGWKSTSRLAIMNKMRRFVCNMNTNDL